MKYFLFSIFYFLFITSLFSQELSSDEKQILMYQDTRTLGPNKELLNYLKSTDEKIVINALYALANISDSSTVDKIGEALMTGANSNIRKMAAFALGQIPCEKSRIILEQSITINLEKDIHVLKNAFEALGKTGNMETLELIAGINYEDSDLNESVALSIARFAIRGIKSRDGVNKLINLIKSNPNQKLEEKICYALYRIRSKELLTPAHIYILNLCSSPNEYSRMWAFSALGYIGHKADVEFVSTHFINESSWKVNVNILNSLPNYIKSDETSLNNFLTFCLTASYEMENPNVRNTGLKVTGQLFSNLKNENPNINKIKEELEWYLNPGKAVDWQDIGEAINSYGMIFKDSVKDILLRKYSETQNYDLKPYIVGAFKYFDNALVWRELTDTISADIQRYNIKFKTPEGDMVVSKELGNIYASYVDVMTELYKKADDSTKNVIKIVIAAFTDSKDPVIIDNCFRFLNSDTLDSFSKSYFNEMITIDYAQLTYPKDKEAMMLFINEFAELKIKKAENILKNNLNSPDYDICKASAVALEKITGKKYTFKTKLRTDFDWNFISSLSKKTAVIKTEYGDIKIKFYQETAPFTIQNFVKLAEKHFYDGTVFHRVVPNFVIQGGDPLNNGWGGCGYSIRSEFSPIYYERGLVGMASDGKDTEGSQFFIMHSPHYHLDGRYTIFGEVTEGMDIVDRIQVGDKVLSVTIY